MIPICEMSKIGKSIEREKELVVTRDSGEVGVGSNCLLSMGYSGRGDKNICNQIVVM